MKDVYSNSVMNNFGAVSLGNNGSMMSPTAVLVDEYETTNGKKIMEDSSYDPTNPYEGRDPRLSYTLYVPGDELPNGTIYDSRPGWSTTGDVIGASYQVSKTGLLPKKYINAEDIGQSNRTNCGINLIIMRYAEILLTAAEARIELNTETVLALQYINQVRQPSGCKHAGIIRYHLAGCPTRSRTGMKEQLNLHWKDTVSLTSVAGKLLKMYAIWIRSKVCVM